MFISIIINGQGALSPMPCLASHAGPASRASRASPSSYASRASRASWTRPQGQQDLQDLCLVLCAPCSCPVPHAPCPMPLAISNTFPLVFKKYLQNGGGGIIKVFLIFDLAFSKSNQCLRFFCKRNLVYNLLVYGEFESKSKNPSGSCR
jgi:hypothetical protein